MQVNLDFTRPLPDKSDKRDALTTFRTSPEFKADLVAMAARKKVDVSALINEYAIKGYLEDYKTVLLTQVHGDRPLRDLLGTS